jgi:type VI protein secretion system component Hcp
MTIKQNQNQAPVADRADKLPILTDGELDRVVGGVQDIVITKVMDATSPLLSKESLMGKSVRVD